MSEKQEKSQNIPDEFKKLIKDFVRDIQTTFPEYQPFISKWWKSDSVETDEQSLQFQMRFIFEYCSKKYPPRFFDILYQNNDIFSETSETDTEFLPFIHFKNLWQCDISEKTRETIWKYLQLILFSIVGTLDNREAFGDTSKLFEAINEDDFKSKLEETLNGMKDVFENNGSNTAGDNGYAGVDAQGNPCPGMNIPNANDLHDHISGMMNGKLGNLAREIAEEAAQDFDIDFDNVKDTKDAFQQIFKNPGKLMNLVKNVGGKLETKMKSGELKESELISEASEIFQKMKNMPGMGSMNEMLSKMGLGHLAKGEKLDLNAMETKLNQSMKNAKMKERMKEKLEKRRAEKSGDQVVNTNIPNPNALSEEELCALFQPVAGEANTKVNKENKESVTTSKKGKKKAKK